jgi:hypothetical protein
MKFLKYTYRGYTVNTPKKLPSGDVAQFEFRNKGTNNVFVNGILLQPTDIFIETQNAGEKVGEPYNIVFEVPKSDDNLLVVIEKRFTKYE